MRRLSLIPVQIDFNLEPPMRELLDEKLKRFEELEANMLDPAIQADSKKMAAVAREHGSIAKLATKYLSLIHI